MKHLIATAILSSCLGACGTSVPGPDEVTATVTEGDEEAWSAPDDPPPSERGEDEEDDELEGDGT